MKEALLFLLAIILYGLNCEVFADNNITDLVKVVGNIPATFDSLEVAYPAGDVASVLEDLIGMCPPEKDTMYYLSCEEGDVSSLTALDFLIGSYEASDYHESGCWLSHIDKQKPFFTDEFPEGMKALCRPIQGAVTSRVGFRPKYNRMHFGMDFAACVGDTVVAAVDGVVSRIGYDKTGYGLYICVNNASGVETRYAHLLRPLINIGEAIHVGQPLALAGNTGRSTGPHLHFEIRYNGRIIDPARFFE